LPCAKWVVKKGKCKVKKIFVTGAVLAAAAAGAFLYTKEKEKGNEKGKVTEAGSESTEKVLAAGTVEATGEGADLARQTGTVFVILRDENPGPPYAVTKLKNEGGQKLLQFKLTEKDIMIAGRPAPTRPVLKVRFDGDGDPLTELPHDVSGTLKGFVLGESDLKILATLVGNAAAN
jgi:hypothetical protein